MAEIYDRIGLNYASLRKPDPRIAAKIDAALGPAETVLNVGAGAGSYEPAGRNITAVEPSSEMIAQRPASDATVVQAAAEHLPFADDSFDAAMASLTIHHWSDQAKGAREMRRVTRGPIVFLTFDPDFSDFWLFDYFPALAALDKGQMPVLSRFGEWFENVTVSPVPIPHDCTDGFLAAYWRRPHTYLDPRARNAMSSFHKIGDCAEGLAKLQADLDSGAWTARYGHLLDLEECDCGYRLIVAN